MEKNQIQLIFQFQLFEMIEWIRFGKNRICFDAYLFVILFKFQVSMVTAYT